MIADVGRKPDAYRSIRFLFIIGVVGLILAASGVTWILVGYAQVAAPLAPRMALYSGSWVEKQNPSFVISGIEISSKGLYLTIHVAGNCRAFSDVPCDMGTNTQRFTGAEPLTMLIQNYGPLAINLSKTDKTKLQVVLSGTYNGLFDKT